MKKILQNFFFKILYASKPSIPNFRAIVRNAQVSDKQIRRYVSEELNENILPLDHPREFSLSKHILKFSDCILEVVQELYLHKICDYIYKLATLFSDFYNECYVVHKLEDGIIYFFILGIY